MIIITRKIDTHPLAEIIRLIHPMCWDELYNAAADLVEEIANHERT